MQLLSEEIVELAAVDDTTRKTGFQRAFEVGPPHGSLWTAASAAWSQCWRSTGDDQQ